jgi:hypothetical protein
VIAIACGQSHCLALKSDGTLAAWGSSPHGETNVPAGLTSVIAVAAGGNHNAVLKTDGSIVTWGANNWGQLDVPSRATNVFAIACGPFRSLAVVGETPPLFTVRPAAFDCLGSTFTVTFDSVHASPYFLLATSTLNVPSWRMVRGVVATSDLATLSDPGAVGGQRFYMVRTQPYRGTGH